MSNTELKLESKKTDPISKVKQGEGVRVPNIFLIDIRKRLKHEISDGYHRCPMSSPSRGWYIHKKNKNFPEGHFSATCFKNCLKEISKSAKSLGVCFWDVFPFFTCFLRKSQVFFENLSGGKPTLTLYICMYDGYQLWFA